jgi:hypothetical protein
MGSDLSFRIAVIVFGTLPVALMIVALFVK